MKTYHYKICSYTSGMKKCYILRETKISETKTLSRWAVIGLDSPEHMKSKGYNVHVDYEFKKSKENFK